MTLKMDEVLLKEKLGRLYFSKWFFSPLSSHCQWNKIFNTRLPLPILCINQKQWNFPMSHSPSLIQQTLAPATCPWQRSALGVQQGKEKGLGRDRESCGQNSPLGTRVMPGTRWRQGKEDQDERGRGGPWRKWCFKQWVEGILVMRE